MIVLSHFLLEMTRRRHSIILCFLLTLLMVPESSAETESPDRWGGEVELGIVATSGNTDTENLNAKVLLVYRASERWRNEVGAESLYTEDSGTATSERYLAFLKTDYSFTKRNYAYVKGRYEKDRFAGFDYRISESAGYGRYIIRRDALSLQLEAGPGGSHRKFRDGETEDELIFTLAEMFSWKLRKGTAFNQKVTTDLGEDNNYTEAVASLLAHMAGNFSMKVSYTLRHNSNPPADSTSTDTQTSVTMVYDF